MESKKPFYITTTLPYVNADPHVGFAMEIIRADAVARYKDLTGYEVFFNTGADEHGMKIYEKAFDLGENTQAYVDRAVVNFKKLKDLLNLKDGLKFTRTTDKEHVRAAQEFWKRCDANGFIYKKNYKAKYCVGCELERTDSEIENGRCFIHQNIDLVLIEEENYFFKFSEFQDKILSFYKKNTDFVIPKTRFNEIIAFVENGLEDFSISRLKEKMPWGVPVPDDEGHVMYVWFDALVNYISSLGWPDNREQFDKFWVNGTPVQYAGKDNLRQQSAMWQAMLMAAGLSNSDRIIINGFITAEGGLKMSKSKGNVISPAAVVNEYGTDALRYFLLREINSFEDSPFTMELFAQAYNSALVNGIGNLTSRVMKLAEDNLESPIKVDINDFDSEYQKAFDEYDLNKATNVIWKKISDLDTFIEKEKPFSVVKEDKEKGRELIVLMVRNLGFIAYHLRPFLPEAADKILQTIAENKKPEIPLFERK